MYGTIMNYGAYISRKGLPFINSADKNSPTGLFSKDIFGVTDEDRETKAALINLHCYVMRPLFVAIFRTVQRSIANCATSNSNGGDFYIRKGIFGPCDDKYMPEPGDIVGGGPRFLYENWDKIDTRSWEQEFGKYANKEMKSSISKFTKEQMFKHHQYVLPIAYRSEEEDSKILVNDINILLSDIIRYSNVLASIGNKQSMGIDVKTRDIECLVQRACNEYYNFMKGRHVGPKGTGRKQILSRSVDNSSLIVMLPHVWTNKKLGKGLQKYTDIGIPIHLLCKMFKDTVIKFSKNFIDYLYDRNAFPPDTQQDLLAYYDVEFLSDAIDKLEDPFFRVSDFPAICKNGTEFASIELEFIVDNKGTPSPLKKTLSWLEFFYITCTVFADLKHNRGIATTRYPVDSQLSQQYIFPVALTLTPYLLKSVKVLDFTYDGVFPLVDDWVKNHYNEKIFEQGSRVYAGLAVGFNGTSLIKRGDYIQITIIDVRWMKSKLPFIRAI